MTKSTIDYYVECLLELLKPKLLRNKFLQCFVRKLGGHQDKDDIDQQRLIVTVQAVACKFYDVDYVNNFIIKSIEERAAMVR